MNWKSCVADIISRAKLVGDTTLCCSNNSISSFTILKGFGVSILPRRPLLTVEVLWHPPPRGWIKVNADGLARGNPLLIVCGGIFRNENVCHVGSFFDYMGEGNVALAELMTTILAIEKARFWGWTKLWMEIDCLLVVKAFSDSSLVPWKIRFRWLRCIAFSRTIDFMISHVFRETNFYVDFLANIGLAGRSYSWFNFVHYILVKDCLLDKEGTHRLRFCY